jgi:hypothetical protein
MPKSLAISHCKGGYLDHVCSNTASWRKKGWDPSKFFLVVEEDLEEEHFFWVVVSEE